MDKRFEIKPISVTRPLFKINERELTPEELIIYIARVSAPKNQENIETSPKLINYCIKQGHWSPFTMVDLTVEITTSRAIGRQILRHWTFQPQEFSQRYAEVPELITYEARRQDEKNRQNSTDDLPQASKDWFKYAQNALHAHAKELYKKALSLGIAKESARFLLPESAKSVIYFKGSVRSWIHYLELRTGHGTQKEHMEIAENIRSQIFVEIFPNISKALGWV